MGVGDAMFAVPVTSVQEILDMRPVTRLPDAPMHLLGVIDVRNEGVPVMDLAGLLGTPSFADTEGTRIVVLRFRPSDSEVVVALKADRVYEVTSLEGNAVEPLPESELLKWNSRLVSGLGRKDGRFVALLDLHRMFGVEALGHAFDLAA
nr:chemotaxis protein CheW [Acuticoccus kalidii]